MNKSYVEESTGAPIHCICAILCSFFGKRSESGLLIRILKECCLHTNQARYHLQKRMGLATDEHYTIATVCAIRAYLGCV
jgi:hypothetical protein